MDNNRISMALQEAATLLSASTDKRLQYALPKVDHADRKMFLWIVFNAIGLESIVKLSIRGWEIVGRVVTDDDEVLQLLSKNLDKSSVVDAYIPWLANCTG